MTQELCIFVPVAIQAIMNSLVARIAARALVPIKQVYALNPAIPERIMAGEAYDIGLTNPRYVKALIADGYADGASHRPFGRVPLAVARKEGLAGAIIDDVQGIKVLLDGAESIAYTGAGTSGRTYLDVLERLDMKDAVIAKSRAMGGGAPVASVATGETELAVAPLTTVLASPGVVPAAVFPDTLGAHIDMSVFQSMMPHAGAAAVLDFLTASERDDELAAAGILRFALD